MKSLEIDTSCKLCGKTFKSLGGLHTHIKKSEGIEQEEYYWKFFPKNDLYTGSKINFENYEDYMSKSFNSRASEFKFIESQGIKNNNVRELLTSQLLDASKKNGCFPSSSIWKSYQNYPYERMAGAGFFDDFLNLSKSNNIFPKKDYKAEKIDIIHNDGEILIDTREQLPLFEGGKTTINVGDYTLSKEFYNGVHVDRKSKNDFISTFTSGLERFEKECQKAKDMDITLVVLVEESFHSCISYFPAKFSKQKVTGKNAFFGVRKIIRNFPFVQFLFVKDRVEAKKYIKIVLNNKELIEKYDLQFLYDKGKL